MMLRHTLNKKTASKVLLLNQTISEITSLEGFLNPIKTEKVLSNTQNLFILFCTDTGTQLRMLNSSMRIFCIRWTSSMRSA